MTLGKSAGRPFPDLGDLWDPHHTKCLGYVSTRLTRRPTTGRTLPSLPPEPVSDLSDSGRTSTRGWRGRGFRRQPDYRTRDGSLIGGHSSRYTPVAETTSDPDPRVPNRVETEEGTSMGKNVGGEGTQVSPVYKPKIGC